MASPQSLAVLGLYFAAHWFRRCKRLIVGPRRQLPVFRGYFAQEGLGDFTIQERALLDGLSRCLACGWCDTQLAAWSAPSTEGCPSPSTLAVALTTDPTDFPRLAGWSRALSNLPLDKVFCPYGVPLVEGVEFLRRRTAAHAALPEREPPTASIERQ